MVGRVWIVYVVRETTGIDGTFTTFFVRLCGVNEPGYVLSVPTFSWTGHPPRLLCGISCDQQLGCVAAARQIGSKNARATYTVMSTKISIQFPHALVIGIRDHYRRTPSNSSLDSRRVPQVRVRPLGANLGAAR